MRLFNQSKNSLRWSISMTVYTCEPWGEVEVPDMFVLHCKTRGLPLDVTPVAAEVRAEKNLSDASDKARSDEVLVVRHELALSKAAEVTAKSELEKLSEAFMGEQQKAIKLELRLAEQKRQIESMMGDKAAADELITESARKIAELEQRAKHAEAALAETKSLIPQQQQTKAEPKQEQRHEAKHK